MKSLDEYVKKCHSEIYKPNIAIVIGNESCDIDSFVSSLVVALVTNNIWVINMKYQIFKYKAELIKLVKMLKININDLIFFENDRNILFFNNQIITLDNKNIRVILVDHNSIDIKLTNYVIDMIIDHHELFDQSINPYIRINGVCMMKSDDSITSDSSNDSKLDITTAHNSNASNDNSNDCKLNTSNNHNSNDCKLNTSTAHNSNDCKLNTSNNHNSNASNDNSNPSNYNLNSSNDNLNSSNDNLNPSNDNSNPSNDNLNSSNDNLNPSNDNLNPSNDNSNPSNDNSNIYSFDSHNTSFIKAIYNEVFNKKLIKEYNNKETLLNNKSFFLNNIKLVLQYKIAKFREESYFNKVKELSDNIIIVDKSVSSCTTLVSKYIFDKKYIESEKLFKKLAKLLMIAISVDSKNFKAKHSTQDIEEFQKLSKICNIKKKKINKIRKKLNKLRHNEKDLPTEIILAKDFKQYRINEIKYGYSTVKFSFKKWIDRDTKVNFLKNIDKFIINKHLNFLIINYKRKEKRLIIISAGLQPEIKKKIINENNFKPKKYKGFKYYKVPVKKSRKIMVPIIHKLLKTFKP